MLDSLARKRIWMLLLFFTLVFIALIGIVGYRQLVQGDELTERGERQWTRKGVIEAQRGRILDKSGKELAQSGTTYIVSIYPKDVIQERMDELCAFLHDILGLSEEAVRSKASMTNRGGLQLKRQVQREDYEALRNQQAELKAKGDKLLDAIYYEEDAKRYYPMRALLAQTLGFTDIDGNGQCGLEAYYNKYLSGTPGIIYTEVDARGRVIGENADRRQEAVQGNDVVLTVDFVIQSIVERALRECIQVNGAKRASAIVMDVNTGGILAISEKPDFDPNEPPRDDLELLMDLMRNRVVSDVYEPGSTFKILTTAIALEENKTSPDDHFNCTGYVIVDGDRIKCWRHTLPHGAQTLTEGLQNSCNPIFVELGRRIGKETFYAYLDAFGIGKKTGIDLPDDSEGIVRPLKYVKTVDLVRIAFGQSIAVTPLQLISACAAVVNGGKLYQPHIVSQILDQEGNVVEDFEPILLSTPISEATSATMREMLEKVVTDGGGKNAYIEGYRVAGKTGTAQKYRDGKIVRDTHIGSFIGFAPADDPQIAVLVIVDEATIQPDYGSVVAAPFAKTIIEETLRHMGYMVSETEEDKMVTVPDICAMAPREAEAKLEEAGIIGLLDGDGAVVIDQFPKAGAEVPEGSLINVYVQNADNPDSLDYVEVPDVSGRSIVEVNRILGLSALKLQMNGKGISKSQHPEAGTLAPPGTVVTVTFE